MQAIGTECIDIAHIYDIMDMSNGFDHAYIAFISFIYGRECFKFH